MNTRINTRMRADAGTTAKVEVFNRVYTNIEKFISSLEDGVAKDEALKKLFECSAWTLGAFEQEQKKRGE